MALSVVLNICMAATEPQKPSKKQHSVTDVGYSCQWSNLLYVQVTRPCEYCGFGFEFTEWAWRTLRGSTVSAARGHPAAASGVTRRE
jgi:hypothetical protein